MKKHVLATTECFVYSNIVAINTLLYENQYLQEITLLTWRLDIDVLAQKQ